MPIALVLALLSTSAATAGTAPSALRASGDEAAQILAITRLLFTAGGVIFVLVMLALGVALFGPGKLRSALAARGWVVGAGIVFPVVALAALLVYTFAESAQMASARAEPAALRIRVAGELWWWRVQYLDAQGQVVLETANEIHLPAGEPAVLELVSDNVIHSFWVPELAGKLDMIPGHVTRLRVRAREPAVLRGQCAEYCGAQHAKMAMYVVAHPPAQFQAWLHARMAPASAPQTPAQVSGQALFTASRCGVCHTVRGTDAQGRLGPDLTHVGSRLTLAAGVLPNNQGAMAGWIASTQHIKPGSRMPAYASFTGDELRALSAYLESLK